MGYPAPPPGPLMPGHGQVAVLRNSAEVGVGAAQVSSGQVPADQHAPDARLGPKTPTQVQL